MVATITLASLTRTQSLHTSPSSEVYAAGMKSALPAETPGELNNLVDTSVVVKRTKITCSADIARFERERDLLERCAHPRIATLLGIISSAPTYALVMPHYARGALFGILHASGEVLTAQAKAIVLSDVSEAVCHLHSIGVLHRDIKTDNILVQADGRAVLTDLNASELESNITSDIVVQARPTGGFFKQFVVGTLPYMAPELLRSVRGAAYTRACDVYSFAIVMNEVATQRVPYADSLTDQVQLHTILEARYNHDSLTAGITAKGLRPIRSEAAAPPWDALCALTERCWHDTPAQRPAAAEVRIRKGF
uniref:Protein kinase domain-containing protein n=1 Tax=Chrysotila carterae TaxID=13221 RepID=A0A7S4B6K8_CHRCT